MKKAARFGAACIFFEMAEGEGWLRATRLALRALHMRMFSLRCALEPPFGVLIPHHLHVRAASKRPHFSVRPVSSFEMAEGEGFEPPVTLRPHMISSHAHSTELCQPSGMSSQAVCTVSNWFPMSSAGGLEAFPLRGSACCDGLKCQFDIQFLPPNLDKWMAGWL